MRHPPSNEYVKGNRKEIMYDWDLRGSAEQDYMHQCSYMSYSVRLASGALTVSLLGHRLRGPNDGNFFVFANSRLRSQNYTSVQTKRAIQLDVWPLSGLGFASDSSHMWSESGTDPTNGTLSPLVGRSLPLPHFASEEWRPTCAHNPLRRL